MAPLRTQGEYAPDAVQVVNNQALKALHNLERELHLGFGNAVCEYVVDKYHEYDELFNSQPDANVHRRRLYMIGKVGAGQATRFICDLEGIDKQLRELRGKANEYKDTDLLEQYQNFLKELNHLKNDALDVLVDVAPQRAITFGERRKAAKALRAQRRGEGEAAAV